MIHQKNTLIVGLSLSALILAGFLGLLHVLPAQAASPESGGDYILTIAETAVGDEALWVLDTRNGTIGIYQYDTRTRRIELLRMFPLTQLQQPADQ